MFSRAVTVKRLGPDVVHRQSQYPKLFAHLFGNPRRLPDPGPHCLSPSCASQDIQLVSKSHPSLSLSPKVGSSEEGTYQGLPCQLEACRLPA